MVKNADGHDTGTGGWADGNTQDGDTAHPDDLIGWNFVDNTNNPLDDNGHGTHTAGTIAAIGNNGVGVVGVNWTAQIMAAEVPRLQRQRHRPGRRPRRSSTPPTTGRGSRTTARRRRRRHRPLRRDRQCRGARAISSSRPPATTARNTDVTPFYPSSLSRAQHHRGGRHRQRRTLAGFSNYGAQRSTSAPRASTSTAPCRTAATAPERHVDGHAARHRHRRPGAGPAPDWTYQQIIQQILSTATPDPSLSGKLATGGVINAAHRARARPRTTRRRSPTRDSSRCRSVRGSSATGPPGSPWTFAGGAGVSGDGSGFTSGNPPAPQGTQVAFLQGTGAMSQAVAGWAAGTYVLRFKAAQRGNYGASRQDFRVLVDGVVRRDVHALRDVLRDCSRPPRSRWRPARTPIAFQGLDTAGGDNTAFVDRRRGGPIATPTPTGRPTRVCEQVPMRSGQFRLPADRLALDVHRRRRASRATAAASPRATRRPRRAPQVAFLQGTGAMSQAVAGWAAGTYVG